LIYLVAGEHKAIPQLSIVMIAAVYGLQALVFVFRRKWDMIGWMIFYILAIPAFSFFLPLYSFWRMDDFSWGATRLVLGESGKKIIVHDEGKFDPRSIPLKSWNDYENELWDKESNHSIGSWIPPAKFKGEGYPESHTASIYGRETFYEPTRGHSPSPSQTGMMAHPPPGYASGRNTPQSVHRSLRPMTDVGSTYGQPIAQPQSRPPTNYLDMPSSRPVTNYLDMPIPSTQSPGGEPTDSDLEQAVTAVLSNADLNSVTKREIRRKLEDQFGMDLSSRKATINQAIDHNLLSRS